MIDKQIIIDGVNVSGCSYYQHNMCTATKDDYGDCSLCCQDYDMNDCYYKQLKRKEQEVQQAMDNYVQLDLQRVKEYNELVDLYKAKEQKCERLKWYLKEIRADELKTIDIELDEYETHCIDTEYTNIINLVEEALEERSSEDCRYKKDK